MSQQELVADFGHRVDKYVSMRRLLQAVLPSADASASAVDLARATATLRDAVRRGRANAREGDIFTPEISEYFRWLVGNACDQDVAIVLDATRGGEGSSVRAQVNAAWPGVRLTRTPQALLEVLPPVQAELEYRFIGEDLVLWTGNWI